MTSGTHRSIDRLLDNILLWGDRLARFLDGVTRQEFAIDELRQSATAKCVEAIGEAAGEIARSHKTFADDHPRMQFSEAYRARNRLSHGYDTIDWEILWDTATEYVPRLVEDIRALRAHTRK